jgi:hypothetical protein
VVSASAVRGHLMVAGFHRHEAVAVFVIEHKSQNDRGLELVFPSSEFGQVAL